jgi:hypothetical protein
MLLLFLALALTDTQQAQHDRAEWAMYQRIQADKESISNISRPSARLVSDYRKASDCYARFHLYKAPNCDAELASVDSDLANVDSPRADRR